MAINIGNPWAFGVGVGGNIISFLVFFAPAPTFYKIYKKKSTESFHSVPYLVALFSAMLWLYFGFLTSDGLLMSINAAGCVIEGIYVIIFLIYASKHARAFTVKLLLLLNVGLFGSILALTLVFAKGKSRINILGWAGSTFAVSVFLSPLSVIRLVIKTRSVEFMPFNLSFFLTLSAIAWFTYGLLRKNFFVALPNVLGFVFGMVQMALFVIYKYGNKVGNEEQTNLPELAMEGMDNNVNKQPVVVEIERVDDEEKKRISCVVPVKEEEEEEEEANKEKEEPCDVV